MSNWSYIKCKRSTKPAHEVALTTLATFSANHELAVNYIVSNSGLLLYTGFPNYTFIFQYLL